MSQNQLRGENKELQYRKTGVVGGIKPNNGSGHQQRQLSTASGTGNGTASDFPSNPSSNRSFKKTYNAQGGQSRGNPGSVNTSPDPYPVNASRIVENGSHVQSAASGLSPKSTAVPKPVDSSSQKGTQPGSRVPFSQSSSLTSDSSLPRTPSKGDTSKGFPLQFGSINPGLMNVNQVPARTSSAPPNMREQQCDEASIASSNVAPAVAAVSKQQMPVSDVSIPRTITQENATVSKATNDVPTTSIPPVQAQKPSVLPVAGTNMPMQYPQLTAPMQYGGPSPQIQSQGMPINSVQRPMHMPLHMGSPPQVQQPVFIPGLQHKHHLMPNQGIIHQGQSFGFNPQLGPQVPQQLGNFGMNIPLQFDQQRAGKFGNARKTVKITHPETHEELRLDDKEGGSPGSRLNQTGNFRPQPAPPHVLTRPRGFYPNSYTAASPYYPPPNSLPLISSSQSPRFNYSSQVPQTQPFMAGTPEAADLDLAWTANHVLHSTHSIPASTSITVGSPEERGNSNTMGKGGPNSFLRPAIAGVSGKDMEANRHGSAPQPTSSSESSRHPDGYSPTGASIAVKKESAIDSNLMMGSQVLSGQKRGLQNSSEACQLTDLSIGRPEVGVLAVAHDLPANFDEVQSVASAIDHGIEKKMGEDQHSAQSDKQMQSVIKEQGETNCSPGLTLNDCSKVTCALNEPRPPESGNVGSSPVDATITCDACASVNSSDFVSCKDIFIDKSAVSGTKTMPLSSNLSKVDIGLEMQSKESTSPTSSSGIVSGASRTSGEANKTKNNKGRKKRKEMLQKAEALGTTADLYMAFKGPEEIKEMAAPKGCVTEHCLKNSSVGARLKSSSIKKKEEQNKELEDWEDVVDASTPRLKSSDKGKHQDLQVDDEAVGKKYSRDFLLTISAQCTGLPDGFEITSNIGDLFLHFNGNTSHDFSGPGRNDRHGGAARIDRRGNAVLEANRWGKASPHLSGRDPNTEFAYVSNMVGFRPGHGPNQGVLRPRGQGPVQHAGGFLPGLVPSMIFQGMQKNNPEGERWQRASNFNKGLMAFPQTPSQAIHRAENKYEVGKVSDEEQAKQRRLKAILNKLTPQNFDKLFEQVQEVNIDDVVTLTGVISQIFDKALMEPTFCEMYANFCYHLASELPDLSVDNQKITFRRLLLNKCQEEFERGEREEEEANKEDDEGENKLSDQAREEKRLKARRRMLGNIRLIGELYKKRMLTERIMHECIKKLLGQYQNVDEENIEALCKLMSTIGEMIDHPKAKEHMDAYFDIMKHLSDNMKLSSRVRFMLKDTIDLRKNKWQQRMKVEGPKKIEDVHRDAAQERLGQASRSSRGPNMNSGMRRGQPSDYAPRISTLSTPAGQVSGYRGSSGPYRGSGGQDVRIDERSGFQSISVPLLQHCSGDEPIMLGPQGGLASGMPCRGKPLASSAVGNHKSSAYDVRKGSVGVNGFISDRGSHSSRGDPRFSAPVAYDHSRSHEVNSTHINRGLRNSDVSTDRVMPTSPRASQASEAPAQKVPSEEVYPDERLRDMSMAAIREYYSAKDEKEVESCMKDLNTPSFYSTAISIWVNDAFERKDLERDMLTKLLVHLTKPQGSSFNRQHLIEGFESVLTAIEDTVTDAPRAPEFLGCMLGNLILENVLPMQEVGGLLHRGGEEPGRLLKVGLAADILGSILEMIKSDKGDSRVNEVLKSSSLRLNDYLPPPPLRSKRLEMFI